MTTTDVKSFADFGVDERICSALADAGITTPFPIQELTLPLALSGADVIGQARTGTGKTLGFGIPLLQGADPGQVATQALVVVPTRELCLQVRDDLARAGVARGVRVVAVYGGKSIDAQIAELRAGAPIVVGTPGRLLDLLGRGALTLSGVTKLVLDEADEMLDLGFLPDVEQLIQATAAQRQTLLFSATMPSAVVALARRYMDKPTFLRADVTEMRIAPETKQYFFSCHRMDKPAVLGRILRTPKRGRCLVFTRTKRMADQLAAELREHDLDVSPIHSDLRQDARERALRRFRDGQIDVLVATEVAARGLDITAVTHVVNYDCPDDEKMYLHRIGRTGRAGAAGVAITFAVWNELARLEMIKKALGIDEPTQEVFSTSPLLDEVFDLPPREPRAAASPAVAASPARAVTPTGDGVPAPKRSSRGGRRSRTTTAARAAAASEAADAEPPPARGRTRTRRRVRSEQSGTQPATAAATLAAAPADGVTPVRDSEAAAPRVRTRTRSRQRDDQPSAVSQDTSSPKRADEPEPQAGGEAARPTGGGEAARPTGDGEAAREPGRRGTSRRGRGRRTSTSRRRPQPSTQRRAAPHIDADSARGTGRPLIQRPLVIEHLP